MIKHILETPHDDVSTGEFVCARSGSPRAITTTLNELWRNGRLHTGDIGNINRDGYFQVTGPKTSVGKINKIELRKTYAVA